MAFNPGYKTRILLGDFSMSPKLASFSAPVTVEMLDDTTFGDDGVRSFIPGFMGSTATMSGYIDADTLTDVDAWSGNNPLTYAPFGLAHGSQVTLADAVKATLTVSSPVNGVSAFDLSCATDGFTDFGVSLHDLEAETADENGTSHDNSVATSNGGVAQLHVTAYSGLTSAVVTIEDSADDAAWATIATFATATGVTAERVDVTGTVRRYVRYVLDVTGTGSVTFQCSFARR